MPAPSSRPWAGSRTRAIVATAARSSTPCATKGIEVPAANSAAPRGGPASWLTVMKPVWMRALPTARSSRCTSIGSNVPEALSANVSAVPRRNSATSTTPIDTVPVPMLATSSPRTMTRTTSTPMTSDRRSSRSVTTPAGSAKSSLGSHCRVAASAIRNGESVCWATSSGPAAMASPSPRLPVHTDDSNQRKSLPRRAGATTSPTRRAVRRVAPGEVLTRSGG